MLKRKSPIKSVRNLVLSVGINERGNNIKITSKPKFRRLINEVKRVFPNAKIHMPEIQWNPALLSKENNIALADLNQAIYEFEGINILPKLDKESFEIDPNDRKYRIHWSKQCANKMLEHWLSHLN